MAEVGKLQVEPGNLPGILLVSSPLHEDARGWFTEIWSEKDYQAAGLDIRFVQDNLSRSSKGVIRGMHFQRQPHAQGKLLRVIHGKIWDVVMDLRPSSPVFRSWWALELSDEVPRSLWIPPGFAHGFQVLSDFADVHYRVTSPWIPDSEAGIRWDDPELSIPWPVGNPLVSAKDQALPCLSNLERGWEYLE